MSLSGTSRYGRLVVALCSTFAVASDWPAWRGVRDTGAVPEKAAVTSWSPDGENVLWKSDIGGRTTPILMNGRLYFLAPVGEGVATQERAVCLDAATGKVIWERRFNVWLTDIVENRVGWTAMAGDPETGNVYAHATGGELLAFDRDGKPLWKRSLTEEFGRVSGYGGRLFSPVVDEDRVIVGFNCAVWGNYARGGLRYLALDKRTGEAIWFVEPGGAPLDTTYATPVVAVIGGVRQLICPGTDGYVYGLAARTGARLWAFQASKRPLNTSPVVDGDHVIVTHSEENVDTTVMGRVVCFNAAKLNPPAKEGDAPTATEVWRADGVDAGYCSPALAGDRLYIVDNSATMFCLDAKTGEQKWKQRLGRVGKGSPVVTADGVLYYGEQNGYIWILKDEGDKCAVLDREQLKGPESLVDEIFGSFIVSEGRAILMTRYGTYALGRSGATVESVAFAAAPAEASAPPDASGRALIRPAELTVAPGASATLHLHAFNALGAPIRGPFGSMMPQWTVTGVKGAVNAETGAFSAAADAGFSAGVVKAKWIGDAETVARVRTTPAPPFKFDFESVAVDAVPPGWVGVGGKSKVVKMDGGKVLMKMAEQPSAPMMRMRAYMTPPIAGGYTIQADMMSTLKPPTTKADMGLINTRYRLLLMGELNVLRIDSWDTMPRVQHDVPLNWKEGIWHRMKFEVRLVDKSGGGQEAQLRGKVWATDEPEPKGWMIECADPYPNTEGSPGPYAYSNGTTPKSKGAEVYFDNIEVLKNE
ncbi:MAG: Outer membrane protein assembly factor BamB [Phycisphaerae bacterium]|nr:Outer membrane protein assembly factor BamB [Phycisphaerae bacterium]